MRADPQASTSWGHVTVVGTREQQGGRHRIAWSKSCSATCGVGEQCSWPLVDCGEGGEGEELS